MVLHPRRHIHREQNVPAWRIRRDAQALDPLVMVGFSVGCISGHAGSALPEMAVIKKLLTEGNRCPCLPNVADNAVVPDEIYIRS